MNAKIMRILQWCNENGIFIPCVFLSKNHCHTIWKSKDEHIKDGNAPHDYATKNMDMMNYFTQTIQLYLNKSNSILELGCNSGANLNHLSQFGYSNLSGIEINKHAINEMKKTFPKLKADIINNSLENLMPALPDNSYDLIFTMAVLIHISPQSNFIFKEMVRVSRKYICVVEAETCYCKYIFPRNYKRIFEKLGCKEILYIQEMPDLLYSLRLFEKIVV